MFLSSQSRDIEAFYSWPPHHTWHGVGWKSEREEKNNSCKNTAQGYPIIKTSYMLLSCDSHGTSYTNSEFSLNIHIGFTVQEKSHKTSIQVELEVVVINCTCTKIYT